MPWTAADIPDQTGRTALVTGANSGIGYQAARALAEKGARVLLGCRNRQRGDDAVARIKSGRAGGAVDVNVVDLDLSDLASVRKAADAVGDGPLDLLINNAGLMAIPYQVTADGFEMQFGTNHLGHFALTGHLLERVLAAPGSRIVNVSSGAHRMGKIDFDNLDGSVGYGPWRAYGQSKLANLLFTLELTNRLRDTGTIAVAAHPGYAATHLQTKAAVMEGSRLKERFMEVGNRLFAQSDEMGSLPTLYAAVAPDVGPGDYIGPGGFMEMRGHPAKVGRSGRAQDEAAAKRLWSVSEELTSVTYPR